MTKSRSNNMYPIFEAKRQVVTSLKKAIGKGFIVTAEELEYPPNPEMGDFAFPCFILAKEQKRNPLEIATELAAKIGPTPLIEKIVSAGPYVNFYLAKNTTVAEVLGSIKDSKNNYGINKSGTGKHILIEYAQPNTHKEFHVGHLRNATLGQSLANILTANGYQVTPVAYIGDIGAHVAKVIWALTTSHRDEEFIEETRAKRLGEIYSEATRALEENPDLKAEVDEVQRKLEGGDTDLLKLWKKTREWSLEEFREIYEELNVKPKKWYYESEVEQSGKEMVKKLLTSGIARKSEGATIVDLEDEGLGIFLILKSDGSSLYATKDLALAYLKEEEFAPDRQLFVVDVRQSLYFEQLIATLKKAGFIAGLEHIGYDMVTLPEGAMSSRKGNIVTYKQLRDEMIDVLTLETRKRHEDWTDKEIFSTAKSIALSSMAFVMLRQDPRTTITFDKNEAMSVDGYTGPYLLYTIARINRLKEKTKIKPVLAPQLLISKSEFELAKSLMFYPEVVQDAAREYSPAKIAQWAFDTAKLFAEYYHETVIIDESEPELTAARLHLAQSLAEVLNHALGLLTIDSVEKM
jgi:arginyl-tRNA synthetase